MEPGFAASEIDTTKPHPARRYDYYLGGKDNYPADQEAAREAPRAAPEGRAVARENRAFLQRAVRFLVREAGIRQIIDVGGGRLQPGHIGSDPAQPRPDSQVLRRLRAGRTWTGASTAVAARRQAPRPHRTQQDLDLRRRPEGGMSMSSGQSRRTGPWPAGGLGLRHLRQARRRCVW